MHDSWVTTARFHARMHESDGLAVLTATSTVGVVGYAVFDRRMSHLHYIETRKDQRRRGVASRLWARVREAAKPHDVTAVADSDDGRLRLAAWGFVEADGMWTWKRPRSGSSRVVKP